MLAPGAKLTLHRPDERLETIKLTFANGYDVRGGLLTAYDSVGVRL